MPKETFFNLQAEKRQAIIDIAIDEFANNDYGEVSISRLVARAGIAKGSFYQYFEDKQDLYTYLLDLIAARKTEMLSLDQPDPEHVGIFRYLHWLMQAGVQFELAYPKLMRIGFRAVRASLFPQEFQLRAREQALAFYRQLVALGKAQGEIAPEIDDDLAAYMFDSVFAGLTQFIVQHFIGWQEPPEPQQGLLERPEVVRLYDQAFKILEHGLRPVGRLAPVTAGENHTAQPITAQEVDA